MNPIKAALNSTEQISPFVQEKECEDHEDQALRDNDFEVFKTFIGRFYPHSYQLKLFRAFPLIQLMADQVRNIMSVCERYSPDFLVKVLGDKGTISDLFDLFFIHLNQFKTLKDPTHLSKLLSKLVEVILSLEDDLNEGKTQDGVGSEELLGFSIYLDMMNSLVQTGRLDLLAKSPSSLNSEPVPPLNDRYRIAVKSCQYLHRAVNGFLGTILPHITTLSPVIQRMNRQFFSETQVLIHLCLKGNKELTFAQKCDISVVFRSICGSILPKIIPLTQGIASYLCDDLQENFGSVIQSVEVDRIALATGKFVSQKEGEKYDKNYVRNHRDIYENYIPRVMELKEWMSSTCTELKKNSRLLQYFPLYLHLGDLRDLGEKLSSNKKIGSCKTILMDEIERFANRCLSDEQLKLAILRFLQEPQNKPLAIFYRSFLSVGKSFSHLIAHTNVCFEGPIKTANDLSPDLFYIEEKRSIEVVKPRKKKGQTQPRPTLPALPAIETTPPQMQIVATTRRPKPPVSIPYELRFQNLKSLMGNSFAFLINRCRGFGVKEALKNGQTQWNSLLCTMKRLMDCKGKFSDRQLFSFIIDIVRNGTLVIEQTLSAFARSSNKIQDQDELKKLLNHDLYQILLSCKFNHGPLPHQFRKCIQEMNRGEILSRELRKCAINRSRVEKLLTKARLLMEGNSTFTTENLVSDALDYFKQLGLLCFALQNKILDENQIVKKEIVEQVEKEFLEFCSEAEVRGSNVCKAEISSALPALKSIADCISQFQSFAESQEIQNNLSGLTKNLLVQLQIEMDSHEYLEHIEVYHHLSKVILLNQMIAERFFLNIHDILGIDYDLKEVDHDLSVLVASFGMNEKEFTSDEWNFLIDGKGTRLLARYPFSYGAIQQGKIPPLAKLMNMAIEMSQRAIFQEGNQRKKGFIPANQEKLSEFQKVVKVNIEILSRIILKITEKMIPKLTALKDNFFE